MLGKSAALGNARFVVTIAFVVAAMLQAASAFAGDTVYYYSSDTVHSEVVVTDQNRNVVERTYYAPYGQVLNRDLRDGPSYTGHEEDPETGLVYMQQRYYDPEAGRFLSVDPVGVDPTSGGNFNRYEYAKDNPYRYIDPTGMTCKSVGKGNYDCSVDENSGKFTKAQVQQVNKAYTNAVNQLMAHPNTKVAVTVDGHTLKTSAGAVGKALIGAIVKTKASSSGDTERASTLGGGLTPRYGEHGHPATTIDSYALTHNLFNGTTNVDRDLSATFIHEGLHELPGDRVMMPLYRSDPTKFGNDHQFPYDAASYYLYNPKD